MGEISVEEPAARLPDAKRPLDGTMLTKLITQGRVFQLNAGHGDKLKRDLQEVRGSENAVTGIDARTRFVDGESRIIFTRSGFPRFFSTLKPAEQALVLEHVYNEAATRLISAKTFIELSRKRPDLGDRAQQATNGVFGQLTAIRRALETVILRTPPGQEVVSQVGDVLGYIGSVIRYFEKTGTFPAREDFPAK